MFETKPRVRSQALISAAMALALMVGATPSQADAEPAEEVASAQLSEKQQMRVHERFKNRRICRRIIVTGSLIPKRICLKQSQWDEHERQSRDLNDSLQQEPVGYAPGSHVR